jgi:hypothetical protein
MILAEAREDIALDVVDFEQRLTDLLRERTDRRGARAA